MQIKLFSFTARQFQGSISYEIQILREKVMFKVGFVQNTFSLKLITWFVT